MSATRHLVPARARSTVLAPAAAVVLALGVAACGDGTASDDASGAAAVEGVSVEGGYGEPPTVEFDAPYEPTEAASTVLVDGDGETIEADDIVTLDYWVYSGETGDELETSRTSAPISLPLREGEATPALIDALVGVDEGSRLVATVPPEPAGPSPAAGAPEQQTLVFVLDVLGIVPDRAEGEPVEPPEGVPSVTTDEAGDVTGIDVAGTEAPEELQVTTLVEGDGEPVQPGASVTIHYTGVLAADGTEFDSSWSRDTPATFPLGNLIQGWQQGLEGVPVGSRVLLQVPSDLGYGEAGSPPTIPADADLVFVIDVLAAG